VQDTEYFLRHDEQRFVELASGLTFSSFPEAGAVGLRKIATAVDLGDRPDAVEGPDATQRDTDLLFDEHHCPRLDAARCRRLDTALPQSLLAEAGMRMSIRLSGGIHPNAQDPSSERRHQQLSTDNSKDCAGQVL
jgi:hypothetical protein